MRSVRQLSEPLPQEHRTLRAQHNHHRGLRPQVLLRTDAEQKLDHLGLLGATLEKRLL